MRFLNDVMRSISRMIESLGPTQWLIIGVALVVIGFIFLRGYGSRSTY
jgi:hypothetical protein